MEGDIHSDEGKGIIPRTVEALFEGVLEADENMEFTFKVRFRMQGLACRVQGAA